MENTRIVVAHPYQQHSFRTAAAIKRTGCLFRYITTVYDKKYSLTGLIKLLLRGDNRKRAGGRRCDQLKDKEVVQFCEWRSLFLLLLYRIDKSKKVYTWMNNNILHSFNRRLAAYVSHHDVDVLIVYDTLSLECIRRIRKSGKKIIVVMDMSAPSMPYMDSFYRKSVETDKDVSEWLLHELNSASYKDRMRDAIAEISEVDYFLVASEFTKKSLEYVGVESDRIFICRYGIDMEHTPVKLAQEQLHCVFIGNVNQKKGFHTFTKVGDALSGQPISFHVVGTYHPQDPLYNKNADWCEYHGYVTRDAVLELCEDMDIAIFPSLADGFGLSVIEAMSKGVVPIVSKNAGVSELIEDGNNGFVMDYWDAETPVHRCMELLNDRARLDQMKRRAQETVQGFTWEKYDTAIASALDEVAKKEKL